MLWVFVLFAGLVGALVAITAMLMRHPNPLRLRIMALLWIAGTGGLALIVGMAWSALGETDE